MSIRAKVALLSSAVSGLFVATTYLVQRGVILPGFTAVEASEAQEDLHRCAQALARDGEHLSSTAKDWAAWDDTYQYVQDANPAYAEANLITTTFLNNKINLLALFRTDGELVWGEVRDDGSGEIIEAAGLLRDLSRRDHPLMALTSPDAVASGILITELGPMMVGARPILTSENQGPIRGALVMGRLIREEEKEELAQRTRVALHLWSIPGEEVPAEERAALAQVNSAGSSRWIKDQDPNTLLGYSVVLDVFGQPALLLRADLPRTISQRGLSAAKAATVTSLAGGLSILAAMWFCLSRMVIKPMTALTTHAVRVGRDGDLRARINLRSNDEIGILAREFDRMVANLATARETMLDTAHRAGMAEVAVEMLHNVGNVLNTVNVSAGLVADKLRRSDVATLGQAAKMMLDRSADLGRFMSDDERGRQLPTYLAELSHCLCADQEEMLGEVNRLRSSIEHINEIVNSQKERSACPGLIETLSGRELLEQAVRLNPDSELRDLRAVCSSGSDRDIRVNKAKVLQILTNLISNARHAQRQAGRSHEAIVLGLEMVNQGERDAVRITVTDRGCGIPPENLSKLFEFGFSMRPGGHGFGLHSAANMARELGGRLTAASDGPGRGAVFTLEFPVAMAEVAR